MGTRGRVFLIAALALLGLSGTAHAGFPGDNGRIVFERNSPGFGCDKQLLTVNPDGTGTTSISPTSATGGHLASWSADGRRIALAAAGCGEPGEIYTEDPDGSARTRVTANSVYDDAPTWSPSGSEIAIQTSRQPLPDPSCGNQRDLYAIAADGSSARALTSDEHIERQPAWSPDGIRIVYSKTFVGYDEFCDAVTAFTGTYLIDSNGTNERSIDISGGDFDWSPDATKIVYQQGNDIFVTDIGPAGGPPGSTATDLTNTPGFSEVEPAWSPDASQIAYSREGHIWVMNADGSNQHQITSASDPDNNPDWQPIVNRPPDCSGVVASRPVLGTVNRRLVPVTLDGANDPDGDPVTLTVDGITQDEPVLGPGDPTSPDAVDEGDGEVRIRAERDPHGDGRVYRISFTASDGRGGSCSGIAKVAVPRHRRKAAVDSAPPSYDSFAR
jgi:dipeptidyl aminopeptidase/acylaminoacyl peptidase